VCFPHRGDGFPHAVSTKGAQAGSDEFRGLSGFLQVRPATPEDDGPMPSAKTQAVMPQPSAVRPRHGLPELLAVNSLNTMTSF
jgi:hypothetical protein